MKKRVLSALLVLCLACGLVSTAWAADGQATPETAAVSVTDAASGETADAADYPARTVEQTVPGTDVTVQVEVPEGALPEDAELTTALVGSSEDDANDQAVADVASELDKAEVKYDGFVALDISFVDADGNKFEPLQPVSVNFTLPAELLPEDVDASTLEVQHLKENEAGEVEEVETVADTADATEGTVTVDAPAATLSEDADTTLPADAQVAAEFDVDGFSTFTLTYSHSRQLSIQVVDTNDYGIGQDKSGTISAYWTSVQNIADEILEANQISDKYELDRAEIRSNSKTTEIKWIKYYSGWNSGFRYSNSESKPNSYDNGTPLNNSTVYFVFKTKDSQVDPTPGDGDNRPEINFNDLPRNDNNTDYSHTSVNFYVNLRSQIANSDGSTTTPETDEFTASVRSTTLSKHPTTFKYTQVGAQYVVLQGATDGSAYAIDQKIRALEGNDGEQGFQIADFPTDDQVFTYLKGLKWNDWKDIKVGDTTITWDNRDSELTAEKYAIRWYVFKYDTSDSWHVDGILVPRYGRLTVTKTFTFNQANLTQQQMLELVPDNFTINVHSDQHSYLLQMKQKTDEDNISRPGWDSVAVSNEEDTSSITFTWGLDVLAYTYTIAENNAAVTNYTLTSATYSATNYQGTTSTGLINNGFTVTCQTIAKDQEGATAQQQANLTNTYTQKTANLTITKVFEGLEDLTPEQMQKVVEGVSFTISADGNPIGTYNLSEADQSGVYKVVVQNLAVGKQYTITETITDQSDPANYTRTTWVDSSTDPAMATTVTLEESGSTVDFHNQYTRKTADLTITKVFHNLPDLSSAQEAAQEITFTVGDQTYNLQSNSVETREGGTFAASVTVSDLNVGNTYLVTETCGDTTKYTVDTDQTTITVNETQSEVGNITIAQGDNSVQFDNYYVSKTGTLILEKKVVNSEGEALNTDQTFTFNVESEDAVGVTVKSEDNSKMLTFDSQGVAQVTLTANQRLTFPELPIGNYIVTEISPESTITVDGKSYTFVSKQEPDTQTVNAETPVTATITNTYRPTYQTLTVEKYVEGTMGSYSKNFSFTVQLTKQDGEVNVPELTDTLSVTTTHKGPNDATITSISGTNGTYTFELKHGESIQIQVPFGYNATITETAESSEGYSVSAELESGTEGQTTASNSERVKSVSTNADAKVVYTNTHIPVVPSGIADNNKPFALLVTAAGIAGLALIGGIVARRRRRRME